MSNNAREDGRNLQNKIKSLEHISGAKSFAGFADMLGINVQTLRRVGENGKGSDQVIQRIANRFLGLTPEVLLNPGKQLPEDLTMTPVHKPITENDLPTEGEQLRSYPYGKDIRPSHLAKLMDVSRPQVHYYLKTTKFEKSNREAILSALNVKDIDVFENTSMLSTNNQYPAVKLVPVMMIRPKDRVIELGQLAAELQAFSPVISPERTFYINSELIETHESDLASSIAIHITQTDRLSPTFQPGAIVLAKQVDQSEWWNVSSSSVALLIGGKLQVRRLLKNDLRVSAFLEVGYFDPQQGSSQLISQDDIQAVFNITYILLSPV